MVCCISLKSLAFIDVYAEKGSFRASAGSREYYQIYIGCMHCFATFAVQCFFV